MWTFIPSSASCPSAPVWAGSTSASAPDSSSLASKAELFVTANGTPSRKPSCWRGWRTRLWSQALFATISRISTNGGADALIGSWLESLASPGRSLGVNKEKPTSDGSGTTSSESSTAPNAPASSSKTSPDSALAFLNDGHWWTTQRSLFGATGLTPFCERWPKEGSMRNGRIYRRNRLARATSGNGFSSWPTPNVPDRGIELNKDHIQESGGIDLQSTVAMWETPNGSAAGSISRGGDRIDEPLLGGQAKNWSTPTATDDKRGTTPYSEAEINRPEGKPMTLAKDVATWTTPTAGERSNRGNRFSDNESSNRGGQANLADDVTTWPTPTGRDEKNPGTAAAAARKEAGHAQPLSETAAHYSPPDQVPTGETSPNTSGQPSPSRRLNPQFCEWLMGAPVFWTIPGPIGCDALGMAAFRCALQQHLSNFFGER